MQHRRVGVVYLRFFGQVRVSFVAKLIFFLTVIIPAITSRCNFLYMFCGVLPSSLFSPCAIYSFIYWPLYIQFLNVTCERRLISARPLVHVLFFIKVGKSYPAHVAG